MDGPTTTARGGRAAYNAVKHSLFADLRGTVLEIGAGKGANFGLLPGQVRWALRTSNWSGSPLPPRWSVYNPCIAGRAAALLRGTSHWPS